MNTFGTAALQFALGNPRAVMDARVRFRRDAVSELARANTFYAPAGRYPFRGWVLLPRYKYVQLSAYATDLQLHIADPTNADNVGVLKNLAIVQARCVTRGLASDRNALYLIELTDGRGLLQNRWFTFPTNSTYNVRAAAYPQTDRGGTFYTGTMNSGVTPRTTWTWATMLQDLWEQMGTFLGAWPGLPYAPDGTPEGYYLNGVAAWPALCDVLDHLGMIVAYNPTSSAPYTIVRQGVADAAHAVRLTRYTPWLEDDAEWIDAGAGRVPATVRIYFRRRNSIYGTEETVRYDSAQWLDTPVYSVDVSAPAVLSDAVGTHGIWSDWTIRYDHNDQPVAADVTYANTLAAQRAAQYYAQIDPGGHTERTYAGALPFITGSQVDGVKWWMGDYGWQTQVVYGPQPPWPDVWDR